MRTHRLGAIVVLGCRVGDSGRASGALLRRCRRAADAYHVGIADLVLACGGRRWNGVTESDALRVALVELGVPDSAIRCERISLSTWGNARYGGRILARLGIHRVAVVTCDFHARRAVRGFRDAGFDAIGLASHSKAGRIKRARRALRESLAMLL